MLHAEKLLLIRFPSIIKPPPKTPECLVMKIQLCRFMNTLPQLAASVAQAPLRSKAWAAKLVITRKVQNTVPKNLVGVDIRASLAV